MELEEILDRLDETRERLLVAIEALPDEALKMPAATNDWSVADMLAHLIAWESELVTALMQIKRKKRPERLIKAFQDVDGYNAQRFAENKDRSLEAIFDDLQGVRVQLEQWLEDFNHNELNDPKRYEWSPDLPLWHIIKENSFGHEEQHLPEIEAFSAKWLADHPPH